MCLPGCLFVCHLILLLMCFLFNNNIIIDAVHLFDYPASGLKMIYICEAAVTSSEWCSTNIIIDAVHRFDYPASGLKK